MKKYIKGTTVALLLIGSSCAISYHYHELEKYKGAVKFETTKNASLTATLKDRDNKLKLVKLDLSQAKLQMEAEKTEKDELKIQNKETLAKFNYSIEEIKNLKKTLALLNNELKSKSE